MRRRFFVEGFTAGAAELRGDAAQHLARVLRAEAGQLYELSDGKAVWLGRVERVTREAVHFALVEPLRAVESALRVTLLLSIIKFDRFEWCLEKATELGVSEIVPLAASRSEKRLVAAAAGRARRWEKILLEAAQQSRRLRPPLLCEAAPTLRAFEVVGAQTAAPAAGARSATRVILSERADAPALRAVLPREAGAAILVIGPEGGWTEEEFAAARAAGFAEGSLGQNILRTETAVIAALACLNFALGDKH
jgi:16S rRNA (uracil1498-N3)-methyltransferase